MNIKVTDIPKEHRINVFIGNLKDKIQHDFFLWELDSLQKAFRVAGKVEIKIMERNSTTHNYKYGSVVAPSLPQHTMLTPKYLQEKREKWICYSCDRKYIKGYKCAKKKLFYTDCEEEEEKEKETSKEEDIHQ